MAQVSVVQNPVTHEYEPEGATWIFAAWMIGFCTGGAGVGTETEGAVGLLEPPQPATHAQTRTSRILFIGYLALIGPST
jgi:hypothetical protein